MVIKMEKHTKKKSLTNKKKKRFAICLQIQIAYNSTSYDDKHLEQYYI